MNNWSISIVKASPIDAVKLANFASKAFLDAYAGTMNAEDIKIYIEKAFHIDELINQLATETNIFHLAIQREEIIGYTKLRFDRTRLELINEKAIELERIYVGSRHFRSGLGSIMFRNILAYSRKQHYTFLWLAVWQKNERAISFYKKSGMEIFGDQEFIVGSIINHDYVMKIKL
jgi:diamine N-acetyltransferase